MQHLVGGIQMGGPVSSDSYRQFASRFVRIFSVQDGFAVGSNGLDTRWRKAWVAGVGGLVLLACGAASAQTTFGPATLAAFEIGSGSGTTTTQNFAPHNGSGSVSVSVTPGNSPFILDMNGTLGDAVALIVTQASCLAFIDDTFNCMGVTVFINGSPFPSNIVGNFVLGSVNMAFTITSFSFPPSATIVGNVTFESGTDAGAELPGSVPGSDELSFFQLSNEARFINEVMGGVLQPRVARDRKLRADAAFGVQPIAGGALLTGSSAGEAFDYPWGIWASYQHTDFEDDFAATAFDADTDMVIGGADFSPWDNFVFGVALGYDQTDADTTFNGGEADYDSWTVGPYLGALLSDQLGVSFDLSMDMSLFYSNVDIDQFRTDPATLARVTSSTDSDRWFFTGNVGAGQSFGNLRLDARTGFLVARDDQDGFTESNGTVIPDRKTDLGRFTIGGEVSYDWNSFVPFVSAFWEKDYEQEEQVTATNPQPANDDDDVLFGTGLRWFGENGVSASFEYSSVLGREDFDSDTYTFLLRAEF